MSVCAIIAITPHEPSREIATNPLRASIANSIGSAEARFAEAVTTKANRLFLVPIPRERQVEKKNSFGVVVHS